MKLNLAIYILGAILLGCSQQPVGKSLLSSASNTTTTTTTTTDNGDLDIQPDNTDMSVSIDKSDVVEISGSCRDLNRKNNRILVEVFTGDDETITPYISNAISDKCQTVDSGLPITDKCFWVTKGIGLVEDSGLPTERTFPQCHDGRFSFSVKLGQILTNPSPGLPAQKYTVRFKLRTLEGLLSDSVWSRVSVSRDIDAPTIDSISFDQTNFGCQLAMSPARFNQNIKYTLQRTVTDALNSTTSASLIVSTDSTFTTTNDSLYSWRDDNFFSTHTQNPHFVLSGLSYTYTLLASYANTPFSAVSSTSTTKTCNVPAPVIGANGNPTSGTCYLALQTASETPGAPASLNPGLLGGSVSYDWAYSDVANWTSSTTSTYNNITASCAAAFLPTGCTVNVPSGVMHYFAFRERVTDTYGATQVGKWSNLIGCRPP